MGRRVIDRLRDKIRAGAYVVPFHAANEPNITTSSFTREAKEYGEQIAENVVLIDGAPLTRLMIDNGVGVTHYRVVRLPRVDQDYFETV